MFENIHFFHSDITLISKSNFMNDNMPSHSDEEELYSQITAFNALGSSADFNVPGRTYLLFPPVNTDLISQQGFTPQGFYLCECWKGYFTKRQDYQSFLILYTISGEGCLEYEGNKYILKENDVFFIDCRKYQYYYTAGDVWNHVDIHFYGEFSENFYNEFLTNGGPVCNAGPDASLLKLFEALAAVWDSARIYQALQISNKIGDIITALLILSKKELLPKNQIDSFSNVIGYMEKHFSEDLTLDFLAQLSTMSKYHFSRMFKKYTGLSPVQYLIQLRLNHSKSMLVNTNWPVKQVAYAAGFHDQNNFINLFKKAEQTTPAEFRKQFR